MTGSNSNTSGANVANVGFWPRAILPKVISLIEGILRSLRGVVSGDVVLASLDFAERGKDDHIVDPVMEEIVRRMIVTIEKEAQGNILYQPLPPDDHSRLWSQTDPVTNFPTGRVKQWDSATSTWVDVDPSTAPYTPPAKRSGRITSPAGASTGNFDFEDILTTDYKVTLTPTTFSPTSNSWAVAHSSFPTTFGFEIVNKTSNQVSVAFFGVPTGGMTWEIDIEDRQTTS